VGIGGNRCNIGLTCYKRCNCVIGSCQVDGWVSGDVVFSKPTCGTTWVFGVVQGTCDHWICPKIGVLSQTLWLGGHPCRTIIGTICTSIDSIRNKKIRMI
jgi:hypothetical protein